MSSRYIARKYGNKGGGDDSRPSSRASVSRASVAKESFPLSRAPSRGSVAPSRGASPTPSYYASHNVAGAESGRSTTPELDFPAYELLSGNNSRDTTPQRFSEYCRPNSALYPFPTEETGGWPRRSPSPLRKSYTDILCTASRRLRERSIPPPEPLPAKLQFVRGPPLSGRPPPAPPRVVASDFYRGKTKSIYEREPLFKDFVQTIPQRYGGPINIYNTGTLDTIKTDFKNMVDDKWNRSQMKDPSVEMSFGAKAYAWRDLHVKEKVPASQRIYRDQSARARATTPTSLPRVYVYHRSTMSPAPA